MYLLDSTTIRRPHNMRVENSTQVAENRTLDGDVARDYFGKNKRIWTLTYENTKKSDYDTIKAIYDNHLSTGSTKTWEVTETNYSVSETNVHIDLQTREFRVSGSEYLSDFTLILKEA